MDESLNLKECFRIFNGKESIRDVDIVKQVNIPICNNVELLNQTVSSDECRMFKSPTEIIDSFLDSYFGIKSIIELIAIYNMLRLGLYFSYPVPKSIYCFLGSEKNPEILKELLSTYQSRICIMKDGITPFSNMHTMDIYKLSLIRADFDLDNFNYTHLGKHYITEKFHFFLMSSPHMDITIVYNVLKNTNGA